MKNNVTFIRLHHGSLLVENLQGAIDFYCNIIGLKENKQRPKMGFEGAWLDIGEQQIHLLKLPATEKKIMAPEHAGRDRHLAIHVTQIQDIRQRLEEQQLAYTMSHSGREALFCRDPDGNGLEFIKVES